MAHLHRLALITWPVSLADLLLLTYWYHFSNAQTKFLLYDPWLFEANERFATSGFVVGSLVLGVAVGIGWILFIFDCRPPLESWSQAAMLNALVVTPGVLLISQTANFYPPLWTAWVALFWLLLLNTILFVIWQNFSHLAATILISLSIIAAFGLSAILLLAVLTFLKLNFTRPWTVTRGFLLLGTTLPVFFVFAVGGLGTWGKKHRSWQPPPLKSLALGIILGWVPCFAIAHYALGSSSHYITNADNLLSNVIIALICGPLLASLFILANLFVTAWLLEK